MYNRYRRNNAEDVVSTRSALKAALQAADGAKKVSDGAAALSAGATALQESGTKTLKDSLTTAERNAAMMLLPVVQSYGADALKTWNSLQETLADTGYDLRTEGTVTDTAYIIRTDLK
jgi:X-X-X-Leu-X-X-Gly heptad repeat protein